MLYKLEHMERVDISMNRAELPKLMEKAADIVKQASKLFFSVDKIENIRAKNKADFVTDVDTSVQNFLQEKLRLILPEAQFMGEEKDNDDIDYSGLVWINDPVDGTTNLIHNFQHSVISLALEDSGELIMGLVYDPYRDELFSAMKDCGAYCNGEEIHVTQTNKLSDCLVSVGTAPGNRKYAHKSFALMRSMYDRCHDVRRLGSAALDLSYVAAGRLDVFTEAYLNPWDIAAGVLIVQEAGGMIVDQKGNPLNVFKATGLLAANPSLISKTTQTIADCYEMIS